MLFPLKYVQLASFLVTKDKMVFAMEQKKEQTKRLIQLLNFTIKVFSFFEKPPRVELGLSKFFVKGFFIPQKITTPVKPVKITPRRLTKKVRDFRIVNILRGKPPMFF